METKITVGGEEIRSSTYEYEHKPKPQPALNRHQRRKLIKLATQKPKRKKKR